MPTTTDSGPNGQEGEDPVGQQDQGCVGADLVRVGQPRDAETTTVTSRV
jgi:hypothetical protein